MCIQSFRFERLLSSAYALALATCVCGWVHDSTAESAFPQTPRAGSARASLNSQAEGDEPSSNENVINGLTLIDAERDQPIQPLRDGDEINLRALPSRSVNIRVDADVAVTRVVFGLDHHSRYREEIARPYSLAGDRDGDYAGWTPRVGEHQLMITPYSRGTSKRPLQLKFTVVDQPAIGEIVNEPASLPAPPGEDTVFLPDEGSDITITPAASTPPASDNTEEKPPGFERGRCMGFLNNSSGELTVACSHFALHARSAALLQVNPDGSEAKVCEFSNAVSPIVTTCPASFATVGALHRGQLMVDITTSDSPAPLSLRVEIE